MDILSVQASSVASESAFSTSGRLLTIRRTRLTPESLEMCMCLKDHLDAQERKQNTSPLELPLDVEEGVFNDEENDVGLYDGAAEPKMTKPEREGLCHMVTLTTSIVFMDEHRELKCLVVVVIVTINGILSAALGFAAEATAQWSLVPFFVEKYGQSFENF
ncbi:zinc finger BED domain-containing protein RICESLEEPER 2 [Tanacetum coccineum]